jgi:peptidoglycan L-alanyl-D-glutamate endopeptidase CwlK
MRTCTPHNSRRQASWGSIEHGVNVLLMAIALVFFLACLIGWLMLFPAGRELASRGIMRFESTACALLGVIRGMRLPTLRTMRAMRTTAAGTGVVRGRVAHSPRRYWLWLAAAALLAVPPALVFMSGDKTMLDGYQVSTREVNSHVASLLQGEQLAPPATLPPAVFATADVAVERPLLRSASRNWALLDPEFTQRLLMVFKIMKEQHGYDMAILEGYRSPERQDALARMGGHVTNAGAWQSWHQHGLAADCAFLRDGKLVITEKDPWAMRGYELYGQVAESVGLTWGGRWKMMDFGHTELRVPGVMKRKS